MRYDGSATRLTLTNHEWVTEPPPLHRDPDVQVGEVLLKGEAADGQLLWERIISDPRVLYSEGLDPTDSTGSGLLTGERQVLSEAVFAVVVPDDPSLARVALYASQGPVGSSEDSTGLRLIASGEVASP